jgi:hypothetical protein
VTWQSPVFAKAYQRQPGISKRFGHLTKLGSRQKLPQKGALAWSIGSERQRRTRMDDRPKN